MKKLENIKKLIKYINIAEITPISKFSNKPKISNLKIMIRSDLILKFWNGNWKRRF